MKVSISGTNSFLGKNIYNYLKIKNFEVLVIQRKSNNKKIFFLKWKLGKIIPMKF